MSWKIKRRKFHGIIGGIGVVIAIAGFAGGDMSPAATIVATFAVWIIGATLANLLTDKKAR